MNGLRSQPVLPISRPASIAAKAVCDQVAEPTPADLERRALRPLKQKHCQPIRLSLFCALFVALSGCAGNDPPPIDNGFCRIYVRLPDPADAVNMKQRANKIAILTNEQSADRECRSGDMGPR
jgi:hypothetical protein